jgi:hypothetical protein
MFLYLAKNPYWCCATELPCRVTALNVNGIKRTKRAVIEAELAKALTARNHEELAVELALAHQRLAELDVFKKAECEVDLAPSGKSGDLIVNVEVYILDSLLIGISCCPYILTARNVNWIMNTSTVR